MTNLTAKWIKTERKKALNPDLITAASFIDRSVKTENEAKRIIADFIKKRNLTFNDFMLSIVEVSIHCLNEQILDGYFDI